MRWWESGCASRDVLSSRSSVPTAQPWRHRRSQAFSRFRSLRLELLEGRQLLATFTPADVFIAGNSIPTPVYDITDGGTTSSVFATVQRCPGQIAWSPDLTTAYVTQYDTNSVAAVSATGVVSTFATGITGPTGIVWTRRGKLLVASYGTGKLYDITTGGNFAAAAAFATGLSGPRNFVELPTGELLVAEQSSSEVTDVAEGGNLSSKAPFAWGIQYGVNDLARNAAGRLYATSYASSSVYDITAGGNLSGVTPFANASGMPLIGITVDGTGRLLAVPLNQRVVYDISGGGSSWPVFAQLAAGFQGETALDTVPDRTPPAVTGTTPSFATSGTLDAGTSSLQVEFSEPVVGGGVAGNYELRSLGPDSLLGTADDMILPVAVSYSGTTATLGFPALPESVYRLTVRDTITDGAGNALDGDGDSAAGGDSQQDFVVVPAIGGMSASVREMDSPHSIRFRVQTRGFGAGQLAQATGNAFDGAGRLEVAGQTYAPAQPDDYLTDGDRTLVTPTVVIGGLYASREVTVPATGNEDFARTVDVFTNPTDNPIDTTVRIVGNVGSGAATTVWSTSDGDTVLETTDQWIGTDDADGTGTPAVVHFIHGPAGLQPTTVLRTGDNIEWTYNLTVPARQTVRLMHLSIVAGTRTGAEAAAGALVRAGGFGGQSAVFLTTDELRSIANFYYPYNRPPIAEAGGPHSVGEGGSVILDASASSDPDQPSPTLSYAWDLDQDGTFSETGEAAARGDEVGPQPAFFAAGLDGPASLTISLRVTDDEGLSSTDTASIDVLNVAPSANPDIYTTAEDRLLTVTAPGVWGNDSDPGNDSLIVIGVNTTGIFGTLVSWNADGSFAYQPAADFNGTDGFDYTISDGQGGTATAHVTLTVTPVADIAGRYLFYNNSAWDGSNAEANDQDYDAIASAPSILGHGHAAGLDEPDKQLGKLALRPGQTASFLNYSSYAKGLNGIILVFDSLANPAALSEADFIFRVGNSATPAEWPLAPAPQSQPSAGGKRIRVDQDVVYSAFPGQPDVVTIIWADESPYTKPREPGAISNQWLQVTVLAGSNSGLPVNDVFYYGNQIGESGNSAGDTNVDQNDEIGARNHPHTAFNPAAVSDPYDFNRDGKVDQNDEILARNNPASAFTRIQLIATPSMLQAMALPTGDEVGERLTVDTLAPVVQEAISRWEAAGRNAGQVRLLQQTQFIVASFRGTQLGEASPKAKHAYLDDDAAGFGWFIDKTLGQDEEFPFVSGHVLGKNDLDSATDELMADRLATGMGHPWTVKLPAIHDVALASDVTG